MCHEKTAHANRYYLCFKEMDEMLVEIKDKAKDSRYMSTFCALLSNKDGTKVLTELLNRSVDVCKQIRK